MRPGEPTPIELKYRTLGAERGFLGAPVSIEEVAPDGVGRFRHFEGGSIYWTPHTDAHEVHGEIRRIWSGEGWESSFLGYPTTDESGAASSRYSQFQGGSISWTPQRGAVPSAAPAEFGRWISLGPRRIANGSVDAVGVLFSIAIDPTNSRTMYVGSHLTGLWKTADGGGSWQPTAESLPKAISAVAVEPSNPERIYVVTPSVSGLRVYGSHDGGTSWGLLNGDDPNRGNQHVTDCCERLLIHPADPAVFFLTSYDGIYRSDDRGAHWTLSLGGGQATALLLDPGNPNILWAALNGGPRVAVTGIYRTLDRGQTWSERMIGCPGGELPAATSPTVVTLALSGGTVFAGCWAVGVNFRHFCTNGIGCLLGDRREEGWTELGPPSGLDDDGRPIHEKLWNGVYADPVDSRYVYLGGESLWRSTDGGQSFAAVAEVHADDHHLVGDPSRPATIYLACDGGLYRSTNRGAAGSWQFCGSGITNTEFYDIAVAPSDPHVVIGGTQDNGVVKYVDRGIWNLIGGFGDGGAVDVDPNNAAILYGTGQYIDSIGRSDDGGRNFRAIGRGLPAGANNGGCAGINSHFQVHPSSPSTLLASPIPIDPSNRGSCGSLYRTLSSYQPAWNPILRPTVTAVPPGAPVPEPVSVVRSAVDGETDIYYAGTSDGEILAAPGGDNWQSVFQHPLRQAATDIRVIGRDPAIVFVAFGGAFDAHRICSLTRASAVQGQYAVVDITDPTASDPQLPMGLAANTLAIESIAPMVVYVGTNHGVYRGESQRGQFWSWEPYNKGLPDVSIAAIEYRCDRSNSRGLLRAGTRGRGAFEVLTDPLPYRLNTASRLAIWARKLARWLRDKSPLGAERGLTISHQ